MKKVPAENQHPCTCEGPEQPFGVIVPAARPAYPGADHSDSEWHEFTGSGPTEAEATDDAERHAYDYLGVDAHTGFGRPA